MSFAQPEFLWFLLPVALAGWRGRPSTRFAPLRLPVVPAESVAFPRSRWQRLETLVHGVRVSALFLLVVALARPVDTTRFEAPLVDGLDLAIVLDRSSSMSARGVPGTPTRFEVACENVREFAGRRATEHGDRVSLTTFARFAERLVPATSDLGALNSALEGASTVAEPAAGRDCVGSRHRRRRPFAPGDRCRGRSSARTADGR